MGEHPHGGWGVVRALTTMLSLIRDIVTPVGQV